MKRLFFPLLFLLSACATQGPSLKSKIESPEKSSQWLTHQLVVNALQSWKIKGRLVFQNSKENGIATLHWEQRASNYELRLIAPFWQGSYHLKGSAKEVLMKGPQDIILTAATAEELLYKALGWRVYLKGLKYWIRGVPEPWVSYKKLLLDQKGRLLGMQQSGFEIDINRYVEQEDITLPEKITIKNADLQLKIAIQSWEI